MKGCSESLFLRFALSGAALLLSFTIAVLAQNLPPGAPPDVVAFLAGDRLTQAEAEAAEMTLKSSPEDLVSHCKLISYYFYHDPSGVNWERHLFWLIDHHPESGVFDIPVPITYLVRENSGKPASPEILSEYQKHWREAADAYPKNAKVLLHAAMAAPSRDLSLSYARKAAEADPQCTRCRNMVGVLIGDGILRLPDNLRGNWTCLPNTPEMEQQVSDFRREIESSTDPEVILDAGMEIKGHAVVYASHCGVNADETVAYGMDLIRKAVGLDPLLIDSHRLGPMFSPPPPPLRHWETGPAAAFPSPKVSQVPGAVQHDDAGYPMANTGGYGIPACLYCPQPQYTREALDAKMQGTVVLSAVITADGSAMEIRVLKSLDPKLDERATEAVSKWRFRPALGPDKKPAAVRQVIQVTFHLY
jgi:TonB family protein